MEGDEPLLDSLNIVVSSARGLGTLEQPGCHGVVGHLEVEDVLARSDGLLKLLSLSNLTRITINEESLGATQPLDHGLGQKIEDSGEGNQLAALHDGGEVLASLGARGHLLPEEIS